MADVTEFNSLEDYIDHKARRLERAPLKVFCRLVSYALIGMLGYAGALEFAPATEVVTTPFAVPAPSSDPGIITGTVSFFIPCGSNGVTVKNINLFADPLFPQPLVHMEECESGYDRGMPDYRLDSKPIAGIK